MSDEPIESIICQKCGVQPADFEVRRVPREGASETEKYFCHGCVTQYLANDTASLIKLHKRTPPRR